MIVIEPPLPPAKSALGPLNKRELERFLAEAILAIPSPGTVSVLLTDDATIRDLNKRFRHKDKATDVLSFPADSSVPHAGRGKKFAGDLAISLETAARQAASFGHSLAVEVKVLLVHGLLHLAGFDHETDAGEMSRREAELRKGLGLPQGLIERSGGAGDVLQKQSKRSGNKAAVKDLLYPPFAENAEDGAPGAKDGAPRSVPSRSANSVPNREPGPVTGRAL